MDKDNAGTPASEPDMIAQVGEMLKRVVAGEMPVPGLLFDEDEPALLITSGLLAVAAELRRVGNILVEICDRMPQ